MVAIDFLKYIKPKHAYPHDLHENWADSDCARSIEDMIEFYGIQAERSQRSGIGRFVVYDGSVIEVFDEGISYGPHPNVNQTIISTSAPLMLTKEDMKEISDSLFEGL